jgi:arginase
VSTLRARCPVCRTLTAVALGDGYQCHVCGREYHAGLVRVPAAWGSGGEAMAAAAALDLPYPECSVVERETLDAQSAALAADLPRPVVVLGGCCCAHVGAIRGLAARHGALAVVWIDAHGDLNTPETSPSGNAWGMPLRMAIDEGSVEPARLAQVAGRSLDPPEAAYLREAGIDDDVERAVAGAAAVYVAFDVDGLEPGAVSCFMPEPGGPTFADALELLRRIGSLGVPLAGVGFTGLLPDADPEALARLAAALGL